MLKTDVESPVADLYLVKISVFSHEKSPNLGGPMMLNSQLFMRVPGVLIHIPNGPGYDSAENIAKNPCTYAK